jgi:hypothetical protein
MDMYDLGFNEGLSHANHLLKGSLMVQMVSEDHPLKVVLRELISTIEKMKVSEGLNIIPESK